jgi:hypothetical protein
MGMAVWVTIPDPFSDDLLMEIPSWVNGRESTCPATAGAKGRLQRKTRLLSLPSAGSSRIRFTGASQRMPQFGKRAPSDEAHHSVIFADILASSMVFRCPMMVVLR